MSFRSRLTLFFVAIVIVPMVSVAFVLFSLIADNENGKADARLAARQDLAANLFEADRERAGKLAGRVGADQRLATALRTDDTAGATRRANQLLRELGAVRIRFEDARGGERVDVGRDDAIAPARRELVDADGSRFGVLLLSDRSGPVYAREVKRLVGADAVVREAGRGTLGATLEGVPEGDLPRVGDERIGDSDFRVASFPAPGFDSARPVRVALLTDKDEVESDIFRSRLLAAGVLTGFLVLAIACALLVSKSLQAQIGAFLDAARRLGRGDFTAPVPTQGRDEFAALGDEFNRMAGQLQTRLTELQQERVRLQNALRRQGEAFGSNLDRGALLEIAVRTAVDGVDADGGRALQESDGVAATFGSLDGLADAVAEAEAAALAAGKPHTIARDAGTVLAHPLSGGAVSVWRTGRPFTEAEQSMFHWLAGQAAVSLDNVTLHETVQRQAVTDELTGLYNHRRFQEGLSTEVERTRRFGEGLGLVMLDIDNFKSVNDTYGHQIGDRVLAEVARVLQECSREIDEPARYGGEELAVVLPGTDLEGAYNLAERVRAGIEALEIQHHGGGTLRVTASFGAAALPESADDPSSLIAAADTALYTAKRSGKNRTVRAEPLPGRQGR